MIGEAAAQLRLGTIPGRAVEKISSEIAPGPQDSFHVAGMVALPRFIMIPLYEVKRVVPAAGGMPNDDHYYSAKDRGQRKAQGGDKPTPARHKGVDAEFPF